MQEDNNRIIEKEILNIKDELNFVNKKLDRLLELMEKDCKKMSDHINFIEKVYDNVKNPFHFIMNKVSGFSIENNIQDAKLIQDVYN